MKAIIYSTRLYRSNFGRVHGNAIQTVDNEASQSHHLL